MRRKHIFLIGIFILTVIAVLWWKVQKLPPPETEPIAQAQTNQASPNKTLSAATAVTNREDKVRTTLPDSATPEERKKAIADFEQKLISALTTPITF